VARGVHANGRDRRAPHNSTAGYSKVYADQRVTILPACVAGAQGLRVPYLATGLEGTAGCQHTRDRLGLLGRENRTESNGASAGESGTVEIELLGNNGSLHQTIPGLSLRARLGALTPCPDPQIAH